MQELGSNVSQARTRRVARKFPLPVLLPLPLWKRGCVIHESLRPPPRLRSLLLLLVPLLLLLLFLLPRQVHFEEVPEGATIDGFSRKRNTSSHTRSCDQRRLQRNPTEELRSGHMWRCASRAALFPRLLHHSFLRTLSAVVEGRRQLHGHRHTDVTVPCSELAIPASSG